MKRHKLSDLLIEELSLVDSPANKSSRAVLMKRDLSGTTVEEEAGFFAKIAKKLGLADLLLTKEDALDPMFISKLSKADDDEDEDEDSELTDDELEELEKELEDLEDDDATDDKETDMKGAVTKADLDALMVRVEATVAKKDEELTKKDELISKLQSTVDKLVADSAEREVVAKAATLVGDAPVESAAVAVLLKQLDPAGQEALTTIMKSFSEVTKDSKLFDAISSVSDLSTDAQTAVEKSIERIMKADPKLTNEQAYAKAIAENPELYDELETAELA